MYVRITRPWQVSDIPSAIFTPGQVFKVRPSLAIYLLAMHQAEVISPRPAHGSTEPRLLISVGALIFGAFLWRQRLRTAHA